MSLATPQQVIQRLEAIEHDLSERQNVLEGAALEWFRLKRDRDKARALAFVTAEGSVAERNARAELAASVVGADEEALWESLKAVVRTLEARASIGQTLLRTQSRLEP